jgi:glycogen operon protein
MTHFAVRAPLASALSLCLFEGEAETRLPMARSGEEWVLDTPTASGTRYGFRADGAWAPERGHWFDPSKLLVDPRAVELDRRFVQDPRLAQFGVETATIVPKAIVQPRASVRARRADL